MSMENKSAAKTKTIVDESLESPKTRRAFELYYNDGICRTEEEVATILGVSQQTVNKWKKRFNWDQRIAQIKQGVYNRRALGQSRDFQDSIDETLGIIATIKAKYKDAIESLDNVETKELKLSDIIRLGDQELKLLEFKYNFDKLIEDTATRLYKDLIEYVDSGDTTVIDIDKIRKKFNEMLKASPEARDKALDKLSELVKDGS